MNKTIIGLELILILAIALPTKAASETCAQGRISENGESFVTFPFFAMGSEPSFPTGVTLYFDDSFRSLPGSKQITEAAIGKWAMACPVSKLPVSFSVDDQHPRPPVVDMLSSPEAYRTTMLISVDPTKAAEVREKKMVLGGWSSTKNQITLPGKCPPDGTFGLPCAGPGLPIDWGREPAWTTQILAHELGHAMGLGHDGEGRNCRETLMKTVVQTGVQYPIDSRHCRLIQLLNDHKADCNKVTNVPPGSPHPCDKEVRDQHFGPTAPGGPGGLVEGGATRFCSEFPQLCNIYNSALTWLGNGGGITCNWYCVSWSSGFGDKGSTCRWHCDSAPLLTEGEEPPHGTGPLLAITNAGEGASFAGRSLIRGFSMAYFGPTTIEFFWNGERIIPRSLQKNLNSPEACSAPLGILHAHCRKDSGFLAEIDTTLLPNGPGTLGIVATDVDGWSSSLEISASINNSSCGDVLPPEVGITRPSASSAVGGSVKVDVSAVDNLTVQSVELLADGQRVGILAQAPYSFTWNTAGLSTGTHRLRAKATDGCGNVATSSEVQVSVDNRQYPYLGAPVALPNRIQIENYDIGLPGVSYFDSTTGNAGGELRQDDVDLGTDSGQYVLGWVTAGEWLEYSVTVPTSERYRLWLRSASPTGGQLALAVDGIEGAPFSLPATGSFTNWTTAAAAEAVQLSAGQHVLRFRAVTAGFNLDYFELERLPATCATNSATGCLQGGRFAVSLQVDGQAATLAATRGDVVFFTVFDSQNVEVAVKILDARAIDGRFWVYHGSLTQLPYVATVTDLESGRSRSYIKSTSSLCGGSDTTTFPFTGEEVGASQLTSCSDTPTSVCLLGDRYRVEVLRAGSPGGASRITGQTGSFTFFNPNNHEVVVKVLDGSTYNGHRWIFFGSLTDQTYEVRVTDTLLGNTVLYPSPAAFCGLHDFDDF